MTIGQGGPGLDDLIASWREWMTRRDALSPSDIDELESHLRDRIDGLADAGLTDDEAFLIAVKRVGELTYEIVKHSVDEVVALPDDEIFQAVVWTMHHMKLVPEGAAAAPVAALLAGLIKAPAGSKVVAVLSGGNVNLDQLKGLRWN